eukprot:s203_g8.t1
MQIILTLPGFELIQLAQGLWGAKSPKPTSLLMLNAPGFKQELRQWQEAKELPKSLSIGRDATGQWSTAALKEYPPALNGAFARGLLTSVNGCSLNEEVLIDEEFSSRCAPCDLWTGVVRHMGGDQVLCLAHGQKAMPAPQQFELQEGGHPEVGVEPGYGLCAGHPQLGSNMAVQKNTMVDDHDAKAYQLHSVADLPEDQALRTLGQLFLHWPQWPLHEEEDLPLTEHELAILRDPA